MFMNLSTIYLFYQMNIDFITDEHIFFNIFLKQYGNNSITEIPSLTLMVQCHRRNTNKAIIKITCALIITCSVTLPHAVSLGVETSASCVLVAHIFTAERKESAFCPFRFTEAELGFFIHRDAELHAEAS